MKVFLSWSGATSHQVALVWRDWLPMLIQAVEPYVSSEDIDKGARWSSDVAKELETSSFGILFVTQENLTAPWLHFEAGALSKAVERSFVSPFLFGIKRSDVQGPIVQFQSTLYEKLEVLKLVRSINQAAESEGLDDSRLLKMFEILWPRLQTELDPLLAKVQTTAVVASKGRGRTSSADSDSILEELLELVRAQVRVLSTPEELLPPQYLSSLISKARTDQMPRRTSAVWSDLDRAVKLAEELDSKVAPGEAIPRAEFTRLLRYLRHPVRHLLKRIDWVPRSGRMISVDRLRAETDISESEGGLGGLSS